MSLPKNIQTQVEKRVPIVTIAGHVDHGKTSLLEALAKIDLTSKEPGQITQSIAAYTITVEGKKITFIDTPGHEAFLSLRRRGGQLADIILLVVAADDGVKPQTQEVIKEIRQSRAATIVAITKTDLPGANPELTKRQLAQNGLLLEGQGGQIPVVEVSLKDAGSLKKLWELISLTSDIINYSETGNGLLNAFVVESWLDRRRGPMALVVLRSGSLRVGEEVYANGVGGKVKLLTNESGERLTEARSGEACWLMGFDQVPPAGEAVKRGKIGTSPGEPGRSAGSLRPETAAPVVSEKLKVVLKADKTGSLEALLTAIDNQATLKGNLQVVFSGIGDVKDTDVYLAESIGAIIVGFRVGIQNSALDLAQARRVKFHPHEIIYQLLDDLDLSVVNFKQGQERSARPTAKILKVFELPSGDQVLGCRLESGSIRVSQRVRVKRGGEEIGQSTIKSLRIGQTKVEKVNAVSEFGIRLTDPLASPPVGVGDLLEVI